MSAKKARTAAKALKRSQRNTASRNKTTSQQRRVIRRKAARHGLEPLDTDALQAVVAEVTKETP